MSNLSFLLFYVQACAGGKLGHSECGPVWQFGVIAMLLTGALALLIVVRRHERKKIANS